MPRGLTLRAAAASTACASLLIPSPSPALAQDFEGIPNPGPGLGSLAAENAVFALCPQIVVDGRIRGPLSTYGLKEISGSDRTRFSADQFIGSKVDVAYDRNFNTCATTLTAGAVPLNPVRTRRIFEGKMRAADFELFDGGKHGRIFRKYDPDVDEVLWYRLTTGESSVTVTFNLGAFMY